MLRLLLSLFVSLVLAGATSACTLCHDYGCPQCELHDHDHDHSDYLGPISADGDPSFVLQGGQWRQPDGDGSPVTITYSYNNLLDGGLLDPNGESIPADFIRTVVEESLGLWAEVSPLHFVEVEDEGGPVRTSFYVGGQYGQIRFNHRYINGPDPEVGQPQAKAQAYFPSGVGDLGGDVFYDNGDRWATNGTLRVPDILGATIHELGHTLGLGHDPNPEANMHWIFIRREGPGTGALHFSDIAGIQAIYGAGVGSVTPLGSVPEPSGMIIIVSAAVLCFAGRVRQRKLARRTELGRRRKPEVGPFF